MKTILFSTLMLYAAINAQAQQYDESRVPAYTLPDPLMTSSGQRVENTQTWEKTRRPEILRLFEDNIYGQMPGSFDSVRFSVLREDPQAMEGKALLKEVRITVYRLQQAVSIGL